MDYIKIEFKIQPLEEWFVDVLTARLGETGFESFMETDTGFEAFIPENDFTESTLANIIAEYAEQFKIGWEKDVIKDRNWNEEWEKNYFQPLEIGGECVVRAPFHKNYPAARYEIIIEPNMAFGTGNHATTSMMIEAILAENLQGKDVLDMGCGTGILGILTAMKNARQVVAIDISEWAVSGTKENAERNNIENISVTQGDADAIGNEKFHLILANIQRNVLLADMKKYAQSLYPGGKVFLSGFYSEDLPIIQEEAEKQGFRYLSHQVRNNWVVAIFQS